MTDTNKNVAVIPLPSSKAEMLKLRLTKQKSTLTDRVEAVMLDNINDPALSEMLNSTDDGESVTGRNKYDDVLAAQRIQHLGMADPIITGVKLNAVIIAMNAVLRRYGLSRDQRRAVAAGFAPPPAAQAAE